MQQDEMTKENLSERLGLIEAMISEGRRTTERWAWSFVLWGVAYYIAIVWASFGRSQIAWPVTMVVAAIVTGVLAARVKRNQPGRTMGRAISAVWTAMGTSLFVVLMGLSISGRYDAHTYMAIVGGMLAVANGTSGIVLRWKLQQVCALVWLATALASCFASETQLAVIFVTAIFFCQIVFGIYGMVAESRRRKGGLVHA